MRAKFYHFITIISLLVGTVMYLATEQPGWPIFGVAIAIFALWTLSFVCQVRLYSPKLRSDRLDVSLGPVVEWASLPALGQHGEGRMFEESWAVPLGGGRWGWAVVPGGREYGFLIVAKRLLVKHEGGHYTAYGHTIVLRPHHRALVESLRSTKPIDGDDRVIIPGEWWSILTGHDHWRSGSPVFLVQDPKQPIIHADDLNRPILEVDDVGPVGLGDLFVKKSDGTFAALKTLLPPDSPIVDYRPEMAVRMDNNLSAARAEYGIAETRWKRVTQALEKQLTNLTDVSNKLTGWEVFRGQLGDVAMGPEEAAERRA